MKYILGGGSRDDEGSILEQSQGCEEAEQWAQEQHTREVELEASEGGTLRAQGTLKWNRDSHTGLPS